MGSVFVCALYVCVFLCVSVDTWVVHCNVCKGERERARFFFERCRGGKVVSHVGGVGELSFIRVKA